MNDDNIFMAHDDLKEKYHVFFFNYFIFFLNETLLF